MNVKITADSTCDLSQEIINKLDIQIIPLYVNLGDKTCRDGVDIVPDDIFKYVTDTGKLPKSAAVPISDYKQIFEELSKKHDAVIHINLSAEFSASHQNAVIASEKLENVYVVDSRNLSTGSGHVVMTAAEMAKDNKNPDEIIEKLNQIIPKVDASFVIDTMVYLHKGGRCSGLAKFAATILKIKPCIEVRDGKMAVGDKYHGNISKSLKKYIKDRLSDIDNIDKKRIIITSTVCPDGTVEMVKNLIGKYGKFEEIIETTAGCTITTHCGPATLGILYIKK